MGDIKAGLENMEGIMKKFHMYLIKSPGVETRELLGLAKLETLRTDNFSELMKSMNPQIEKWK